MANQPDIQISIIWEIISYWFNIIDLISISASTTHSNKWQKIKFYLILFIFGGG